MHPNGQIIERFYENFSQRNYEAMVACYSPEIEFTDPIFSLKGKQVRAMWHMLCESGTDLEITFSDIFADDRRGRVHWEARYTFSTTGRKIHNIIDAEFTFQNGSITRHRDNFGFWRWSRMAFGPVGLTYGWTTKFQSRVQHAAMKRLDRFIASHPEYQQ